MKPTLREVFELIKSNIIDQDGCRYGSVFTELRGHFIDATFTHIDSVKRLNLSIDGIEIDTRLLIDKI